MSHRRILPLALVSTLAAVAVAPSADAATSRFFTTNAEQTFVVPAGVTAVHVVAVGAPGGRGANAAAPGQRGGNPASATADLPVIPGQTLFVEVGGRGGDASVGFPGSPGFNGGGGGGQSGRPNVVAGGGGGGGGGASDVRTVSRTDVQGTLRSRVVVAGGGGGSGGGTSGGLGGTAGPFAGAGTSGAVLGGGTGGPGATPTAAGAGRAGAAGFGALGGSTALNVDAGAGGGGGGGLFGGSGGNPGSGGGSNGGGGGAGSSGFGGSAINGTLSQTIEEPQVTISFTDPPKPAPAPPAPPAAPELPATAPDLEDLHASPSRFKAAGTGASLVTTTKKGTGTRLTWTVSSASMTTFEVLAPRPGRKAGGSCVAPKHGKVVAKRDRCTRFASVGSFVHEDLEGDNAIRFTGRVKGRKLARGSYRLEATPSLDDVEGETARIPFTIK